MNIYELKIERNLKFETEREQIYNFLDTYMGQPGLIELADNVDEEAHFEYIGKFATTVFQNVKKEPEYIYGLVFFEDGFGDFIECLHTFDNGEETVIRWAR